MQYFAHADNDVVASSSAQISPEITVSIVSLFILAILWLMVTYIFKWRMGARLNLATALLFVVGVISFSVAPIAATVALAVGMALALFSVVVSIGIRKA